MENKSKLLHIFAQLLSYPGDDYKEQATELFRAFDNNEVRKRRLVPFYDFI